MTAEAEGFAREFADGDIPEGVQPIPDGNYGGSIFTNCWIVPAGVEWSPADPAAGSEGST